MKPDSNSKAYKEVKNTDKCSYTGKYKSQYYYIFYLFIFLFFVFLPFLGPLLWHMEVPRLGGPIGAVAVSLRQSQSNAGSELRLQPTPQLAATPDG